MAHMVKLTQGEGRALWITPPVSALREPLREDGWPWAHCVVLFNGREHPVVESLDRVRELVDP